MLRLCRIRITPLNQQHCSLSTQIQFEFFQFSQLSDSDNLAASVFMIGTHPVI